MKKSLLVILFLLMIPSFALGETLTASFYPIYLFTSNLIQGIDQLSVHCLTAPGTGCLHDYQLSTADMKSLSQADAFLINGAGMEGFLSFVIDSMPDLPVITASDGISLLPDEDGETEYNAHVWLDAQNAQIMVKNLANGLIELYPQYSDAILCNLNDYLERLNTVDCELKEALAPLAGKEIITFHEAFPYFAQAYGLKIGAVITHEADESLSAYQLSQLVKKINQMDTPILFIEPQYDDIVAQTLSAETGAPIFTLDPCVTGGEGQELNLSMYEDIMRANEHVLLQAYGLE